MVIKAHRLTGVWEKTKGLIGAQKAYPVFFETRWGIHTFGVRFPIDIIVLDKNFRVVKIKEKMNPDNIWAWPPIYNNIIELPAGEVKKRRIGLGVKIALR